MKKILLIVLGVLSFNLTAQTTELTSLGSYVWDAVTEPSTFSGKLKLSFVNQAKGFPSYGSVMAGGGYPGQNNGGVFQLYFPYHPAYGGVAPKVRLGRYNTSGWGDWETFFTTANANKSTIDWNAKKLIAEDDVISKGRLSLRSSSSSIGDIISLFGNRFNQTDSYGLGVESGATYYKSLSYHRWYLGSNADNGVSAKMELNGSRLFVAGNVGIGTKIPQSKLDLGSNHSLPGDYPNKITLWSGGKNNYFGFGVSSGSLDYFSQYNHRFFTGYNGTPGTEKMVIKTNGNVGIGTASPDAKLTVKGNIHTQEVKVDLQGAVAPDYVFLKSYNLKTLEEVSKHITEKGHLPNVPSAKEMEKDGVKLKVMTLKLLEKIEELTLYTIQQEKKIKKADDNNNMLLSFIEKLEKRIAKLENK